jgi:hypothetical protein
MKYFEISRVKEFWDIKNLIRILSPQIKKNTVIVNCSPDYSSIISQQVIHAYFDNPLPMVNFDMPFPNSPFELEYESHCRDFVSTMDVNNHYVFIDSGVLRGYNFKVLSDALKTFQGEYHFACLYMQDDAIFTPDFYVEKFNKKGQGMLLFYWENSNCTLFD